MSFYGKVDESEHAKLESLRKARRRLAVIVLSAVVLAGVVVAAVLGTTSSHHNNNNKNGGTDGNGSESASVKAVCDVTLHKEACYRSIGSGQGGDVTIMKPEELFKLSIEVALSEVSKVVDGYFSNDDIVKDLFGSDNRSREAFVNCKELLGLAVDYLNASLASSSDGKSSLLEVFEDLQTWLSASGTYQQTCIDGFEESKETLKNTITNYLKNSTDLTSNSLAIITWLNKAATTLNLRRRLLTTTTFPHHHHHHDEETLAEASLPSWLHHRERKLLQVPDTELRKRADIVVAKDGSGRFRTISEALRHVHDKNEKRTVIYVKKGVYYENVKVEKTKWNVLVIGDGMTATIVSAGLNFVDGTPTFSSATFVVVRVFLNIFSNVRIFVCVNAAVFGRNFVARDIGFRNTAGPEKHQAVALMTSADQAVFYRCHIDAFQDTLYAHAQRQFYRECNIYGTVDFIFGNSAVIIQNCNILPKVPMKGQMNTITAQGKIDPNMNTGISIQNCNISPFGNLSSVETYLGRPWKNYSTTLYMQSSMGGFIHPSGWLPWVGNSAPDTIFYAEFQNYGPGASTKDRVKWRGLRNINARDANSSALCCDGILLEWEWFSGIDVAALEDYSCIAKYEVYCAIDVTFSVELPQGMGIEGVLVPLEAAPVEGREVRVVPHGHRLVLLRAGRVPECDIHCYEPFSRNS
ncbi:putative pectinesterase/pectinesterase inhibitor 24 [Senna tora]|uniref:Pectinesterase n=1 Tax=Senna tora TaxID=362788 RepID=A0A834TNM8_9FABA|nr:putative pectinesterase/pectinesterase inhibitor 24 [Senna tora]